jgi:hypothetical protein
MVFTFIALTALVILLLFLYVQSHSLEGYYRLIQPGYEWSISSNTEAALFQSVYTFILSLISALLVIKSISDYLFQSSPSVSSPINIECNHEQLLSQLTTENSRLRMQLNETERKYSEQNKQFIAETKKFTQHKQILDEIKQKLHKTQLISSQNSEKQLNPEEIERSLTAIGLKYLHYDIESAEGSIDSTLNLLAEQKIQFKSVNQLFDTLELLYSYEEPSEIEIKLQKSSQFNAKTVKSLLQHHNNIVKPYRISSSATNEAKSIITIPSNSANVDIAELINNSSLLTTSSEHIEPSQVQYLTQELGLIHLHHNGKSQRALPTVLKQFKAQNLQFDTSAQLITVLEYIYSDLSVEEIKIQLQQAKIPAKTIKILLEEHSSLNNSGTRQAISVETGAATQQLIQTINSYHLTAEPLEIRQIQQLTSELALSLLHFDAQINQNIVNLDDNSAHRPSALPVVLQSMQESGISFENNAQLISAIEILYGNGAEDAGQLRQSLAAGQFSGKITEFLVNQWENIKKEEILHVKQRVQRANLHYLEGNEAIGSHNEFNLGRLSGNRKNSSSGPAVESSPELLAVYEQWRAKLLDVVAFEKQLQEARSSHGAANHSEEQKTKGVGGNIAFFEQLSAAKSPEQGRKGSLSGEISASSALSKKEKGSMDSAALLNSLIKITELVNQQQQALYEESNSRKALQEELSELRSTSNAGGSNKTFDFKSPK